MKSRAKANGQIVRVMGWPSAKAAEMLAHQEMMIISSTLMIARVRSVNALPVDEDVRVAVRWHCHEASPEDVVRGSRA